MPYLRITAQLQTVELTRRKYEYVCNCCDDEYSNIIDKSFIRKFHLCSYCYEKQIGNNKCDCKDHVK